MKTAEAPPQTAAAAQADNLSFSYGDRLALDNVSLEVPAGAVFGLLGPNGSGKSTLLSLFAGLRQPASGDLRILGERPSTPLRARIGVVFQESSLDPLMTVREALSFHGRLFGLTSRTIRERSRDVLEAVALADRSNGNSGGFSRSWTWQVSLGAARLGVLLCRRALLRSRAGEGSGEALRIEWHIGRFQELLRRRRSYGRDVIEVRDASWRESRRN